LFPEDSAEELVDQNEQKSAEGSEMPATLETEETEFGNFPFYLIIF